MSDVISTKTKEIKYTVKIEHVADYDSDCEELGGFQEDPEVYAIHRRTGTLLGEYVNSELVVPYEEVSEFIYVEEGHASTTDWKERNKFVDQKIADMGIICPYEDGNLDSEFDIETMTLKIYYEGYKKLAQIGNGVYVEDRWNQYFVPSNSDYKGTYDFYVKDGKTPEEAHAETVRIITEDYKRFSDWANDLWSFIGIRVTILDEYDDDIAQASLIGIESDSEDKHIKETEIELLEEAINSMGDLEYIDAKKFVEGGNWDD